MYCQKCGTPNPEGANNCSNCGAPLSIQTPQSFPAQPQQPAQKPKKKRKGCLIVAIIFAVIIIFVAIMIGVGSKGDTNATTTPNSNVSTSKSDNNISNYKVALKDYFVTKDYDGKSVLVVTYTFTNNGSEKANWNYTISADAFQDGVGLTNPISSYGINGYDFESQDKDLMTGKSVDVQEAYYLDDAKTDVEIQLSLFSAWDDKVYDTFTIKLKK